MEKRNITMKPEPLEGKWDTFDEEVPEKCKPCLKTITIEEAKKDVRFAVEWYKEYVESPYIFVKDYPEYKIQVTAVLLGVGGKCDWRRWLLNKAFADVMKKGDEE
jgi:hypothetical protein